MNNAILITIKKELRAIIRDKKSLLIMLLTPLMIPVFILLYSYLYDDLYVKDKEDIYKVGINYTMNREEKELLNNTNLEIIEYNDEDSLIKAYDNKEIPLYVVKDENNKYILHANNNMKDGAYATNSFVTYLETYKKYKENEYLINNNINPVEFNTQVEYELDSIEGDSELQTSLVVVGFIFAIMAISLTAIYCATDSTAGEKERGTLETLLTFPIKSKDLVTGKYLAIVISCIVTSIISTILIVLSFKIAMSNFSIYNGSNLTFNVVNISLGLLIMVAYSMFVSGACIAIASLSKTYKEAQSSLTPVSMVTLIPMFLEQIEIKLNHILALIPVINHTMLLEQVFETNTINTDLLINLGLMLISTIIYSIIILKIISIQYKSEKVLFQE